MSDLSQKTRELLARGREGEAMAPAHRHRLKKAILAQAAAASIATTATTAAAWTSMTLKVVGVVSAITIAGVGLGVLSARSDRAREARGANVTASVASSKAARTPAIGPQIPPISAIAPAPLAPSVPSGADPTPLARAPIATPVTPPSLPTIARGAPIDGNVPRVAPVDAGPGAHAGEASPATPSVAPSASAPSSLAEQARLIRDAHGAVADGKTDEALALLDEHALRFPNSELEPERSAERVFAYCRAGRIAEAESVARDFLAAHSSGPLANRVRASCAMHNGPRADDIGR